MICVDEQVSPQIANLKFVLYVKGNEKLSRFRQLLLAEFKLKQLVLNAEGRVISIGHRVLNAEGNDGL